MPELHQPQDDAQLPSQDAAEADDDYEEITSEEVDRIVEALETLIEGVESENIRAYLEEAADSIYNLVYGEEDGDYAEEAA